MPSAYPSEAPSEMPSCDPSESQEPTMEEGVVGDDESEHPSEYPSNLPSATPSTVPSDDPTVEDVENVIPGDESETPSKFPSDMPSAYPSEMPSCDPSESQKPTVEDAGIGNVVGDDESESPSKYPSDAPSEAPSEYPSNEPSKFPSDAPSEAPSEYPSSFPSDLPSTTMGPTQAVDTNSVGENPTEPSASTALDSCRKDGRDIDIALISDANFASGADVWASSLNCLAIGEGSYENVIMVHNILDWKVFSDTTGKRSNNRILLDYSRSVLDTEHFPGVSGEKFADGIIANSMIRTSRYEKLNPGDSLDSVPGGLHQFKTVVMMLPFEQYSCTELDSLRSFVNCGGRLVVLYDSEEYNSLEDGKAETVINNVLGSLGSTLSVHTGNSGEESGLTAAYATNSPISDVSNLLCYASAGKISTNGGASDFAAAKTSEGSDLIIAGNSARKSSIGSGFCDDSVPSPTPTTQPSEVPWIVENDSTSSCVDNYVNVVIIGDANFVSGTTKYTENSPSVPNCLAGDHNNVEFLRAVIDWETSGTCTEREGGKFLIDASRTIFDDSEMSEFGDITGADFANGLIAGLTSGGSSDPLDGRFDILSNGQDLPATLDEYKTLILLLPVASYNCCEMDSLLAFVNSGGRLVIVYEASPVFGSGDSIPDYNEVLGGLPAKIINDVLGGIGSPLTVGTGFVSGYPPNVNGAYLEKETPINSGLSDLHLCHGVGAPIFTNGAIGQFEVVEYGGPECSPLVVAGRTTHPQSVPEGYCTHLSL